MSGAERTASQRLIASVAVIGIVYYAAALILLPLMQKMAPKRQARFVENLKNVLERGG
jgi:hypothetical protein